MKDLLDDFGRTINSALEHLLQISENQSNEPRAAGKWSPKEIIGHLIDSAANNHQRFVRAQFTDELVFPGYEQNNWVTVQAYKQEPWDRLVQLWQLYNQHLLHVMSATPQEQLTKLRYKHNLHQIASQGIREDSPATLEYFMRDYVWHLKHHLKQILPAGEI